MSVPIEIEGVLSAEGRRFALVATRFNHFIVDHLVKGALDAISRHGGDLSAVTLYRVPGGFELPLACRRVARAGTVDAIIALGAIIRGATPHFDQVATQANRGLAQVALEVDVPIAIGVLTCDSIEQAIERAGTKSGNKGFDAAMAAIEMASLLERIGAG